MEARPPQPGEAEQKKITEIHIETREHGNRVFY